MRAATIVRTARRFRSPLAVALALCAVAALPAAAQEVDSFTTNQAAVSDPPGGASSVATGGADILGQRRGLSADLWTGAGPVTAEVSGGALTVSVAGTTPDSRGEAVVTWDGDSDPLLLSPTGLGGVSLAGGGDAFRLTVASATAGVELTFTVYTDAGNASTYGLVLPAVASPTDLDVPFASFLIRSGAGADFANVGAVTLAVRGTETTLVLDRVQVVTSTAVVTASLTDNVTSAQPGDTLNYTATLGSTGPGTARDLTLNNPLDPDTTLVPGSVEVSPLALDDQYVGTTVGTAFATGAPGVLLNDVDGDGDPLTVSPAGARATAQGGSADVSADGSFTYTPPASFRGLDTFPYQADDGNGIPGPGVVTIHVDCAAIAVSPTTLDPAVLGTPYGPVTFTATGTTGAVTWSVLGTLPAGLNFSAAGVLDGTPKDDGLFPLTFVATDSVGCTGSQAITLTVNSAPEITSADNATFAPGLAGQTFTVTTTGFPATPMTITRTGTLPAGVTFTDNDDGTATIAGTPEAGTQSGSPYLWTITASNGIAPDAVQDPFTFNVVCPVITVSGTIPALTFNAAMSAATFTQTGGNGTIGWSATGLPAGLSIGPVNGQVTGTPTVTGTFDVVVTATDAGDCTGTANLSVTVAPVAVADTYNGGVDNTQYVVTGGATATPATPSVQNATRIVANDLPNGGVAATAGTFATGQGGSVTIAADGTFLYTPPVRNGLPAITSDTFSYTVQSNTGGGAAVTSAPATVTVNLAGRVWYVLNNGLGGNGQSQTPFLTLAQAQGASTANDHIFVYRGSGTTANLNTALQLKAGQSLIGQGAALVVNGNTLVAAGTNPLITNTTGNAVTVVSGNTISGLTISNPSGVGITGATVNTLTVSAGVVVTGANGGAFSVNGGNGTVDFGATVTNTSNRAISIQSRTGGTVTLTGSITDTGAGVLLNGNTGATINFTGGLALNTGANPAFTATAGGTVNATQNNTTIVNTLAATTGTALNVANTNIGASGLTFRSISSNGAASGIILQATGSAGSLSVTGNGGSCTSVATCTGGAVQNSIASGVRLNGTLAPVLTRMIVTGSGTHGIDSGAGVNGLSLVGSRIANSGNADNEHGLNIVNALGTVTIDSTTFDGASEDLVHLENTNQNVTLNVTNNSQFINPTVVGGFANSAILLIPHGTASVTASIQNSAFTNVRGVAAQIGAGTLNSNGTQNFTFSNNAISVTLAGRASGVVVSGQELTTTNITIQNNNFSGAGGNGVISIDTNDTSLVRGTISNNVIATPPGIGVFLAVDEAGRSDVTLNGNTITNAGGDGIQVVNFGGAGVSLMDMIITNNQVNGHSLNTGVNFVGGVSFTSFEDSSCLALRGNSVTGTPAGPTQCGGAPCVDYYLEEVGGTTTMEEVPDTGSATANAAYVNSINDAGPVTIFGTITLTNGAACNLVP